MFHYIPRHFKIILAFVFAEMFLFSTVMKIPIDFHILDHCMGGYTRDRNHQPTYFLDSGCFWSSFFFSVPRPTWSATYIGPSEAYSPDGCQSQGKGALSAGEAVKL